MNPRQFRIKTRWIPNQVCIVVFISNYGDSRHGNFMADIWYQSLHRLESENTKKKKRFFLCISERFLSSFDIFYPLKVEYYCIFGIYSSKREN